MTKAVTKTDATQEPKASPEGREPPTMKASALTWQHDGYVYREAVIRLPVGMILQDLQDVPGIFKQIQQSRQTSLRRFDRVTCIAHDESFLVRDAIVIDADA